MSTFCRGRDDEISKFLRCVTLDGPKNHRDVRIHKALIAHYDSGDRFVSVRDRANNGRRLGNLPNVHVRGRYSRGSESGA